MTDPTGSAAFFAALSRDLLSRDDAEATHQRVVDRAVGVLAGSASVSLLLAGPDGSLETVAASAETAWEAARAQQALGQGPALDVLAEVDSVLENDLASGATWDRWGPHVAALGPTATLAVRLGAEEELMGSLTWYAHDHAFTPADLELAVVYAAHATNALVSAHRASALRAAVEHRHVVGVAQGIVMQGHDVGLQRALELLQLQAGAHDSTLHDLARRVVETGDLPETPNGVHARPPGT
jgi:GAF domain-containing protein